MSYSAFLILSSSAAAIQTRVLSPATAAKECWICYTDSDGIRHHGASSSLKAVRLQTGKLDGFARRNRSTTAVNAGLGRYSGAVHGNFKGKSRSRRRPPVQEDYCEEGDEHQDGKIGSDGLLAVQNEEDQSGESSAGVQECETFAAAEGIISEDGSSDDGSPSLSYRRYLLELGVSPCPREKDSKLERESRELPRDLHGVEDESSFDEAPQVSDEGNHDDLVSQVGNEPGGQEDLGSERIKESDAKRVSYPKSGRGNFANKSDLVTANEIKREIESISVDKTSSVDATEFPAPEPKFSSVNKGDEQLLGYDAETENAGEPRSGFDGGPVKRKRGRKKSKSKPVVESILKVDERGDNDRVRASSGGAERPAMLSDAEVLSLNGSVTAFKEDGHSELKMNFGTGEAPNEEASLKSTLEFSPVADSSDRDGQCSIPLASVADSDSMIGTSNEDKSADTALNVLGKAGEATRSESFVLTDESEELMLSRFESMVGEQPAQVGSQVVETVLEQAVLTAAKVVPVEIVEQAAQVANKVVELPVVVVEQATQVGGQVIEILPDVVTEQVGQVVDQVSDFAEQVANTVNEQVIEQVGQVVDQVSDFADQVGQVVDHVSDVAEQVANTVNEQVEQVAESVASTASQVAEQVNNTVDTVTDTASQVVDQVAEFFTSDEDDDSDSDDEFEAYITSELPEFRGKAGLHNFIVKQEDQGILSKISDIYAYMLKQSFPKFAAAMFSAPILVSGIFILLYLPEFDGLAFDETARDFFAAGEGDRLTLSTSWNTVFQVFMFSLSLSTGLQPELAPLSPYTLIVANLNALVAQLVFVFLSGAVFARLSQPAQPLRCSTVALVSASPAQRRRKENAIKVFMARYVLAGPQPCELVDVKVDLTYKYNTYTRTGSFFRATQSLKLVRPEIAFLTYGMLVRHVIDENSPLYQRTSEMLNKEDAVFCLSVVGLERASMQSVFHVQHYCVVDNDVIWDAEFEDIILMSKKNRRVVDHSRLSMWRPNY